MNGITYNYKLLVNHYSEIISIDDESNINLTFKVTVKILIIIKNNVLKLLKHLKVI